MSDETMKPCELPCPKCGSAEVGRRFFAAADYITTEQYGKSPSRYATGQGNSWQAFRDHLQHRCKCCGYAWGTLPLSNRKRKAASDAPL